MVMILARDVCLKSYKWADMAEKALIPKIQGDHADIVGVKTLIESESFNN
ncbi:MAG: hypothetical protein JKX94_12345 [Sneathiella sp.]|nr:hypothetical protein [Sneathiella sp.]